MAQYGATRSMPHAMLIILAVFLFAPFPCWAQHIEVRKDLEAVFAEAGVSGTFVVQNLQNGRLTVVNPQRAHRRFIPASTFKIANSIIALEVKAVADETEIIPHGGKPQPFKQWEKDMSMRDAIAISNVPIYQELARRIGLERYDRWLKKLDYGNRLRGTDVERFWLDGPLAISAVEQAEFLRKLASGDLPISSATQRIVVDILKLEVKGSQTLYGKTGWSITPDPDIGWFVGWISDRGRWHAFALNMEVKDRSDAGLRIPLAKRLLRQTGVLK